MTVYAVIKVFDTLAEADRFAEQVTEDDIVAVFPLLDAAEAPVNRDSLSASAASSGLEDLGMGLPATLTAGESNRPARVFYLDEHPRASRWERRHWGYSVKV